MKIAKRLCASLMKPIPPVMSGRVNADSVGMGCYAATFAFTLIADRIR